ncbi:Uncharacterised protein [Salmonella enterica subsp. enterica serovar Bovismorbificans]|uniref:Uncharacterized protein n=1 Tax=Salmonella enterica subsp. enterica serovar Bovismorbificans TaxID=58097 RepID=A0A655D3Y2_SALET|nr:Uncharacterised protein [Salmonella enterica subsp. enterica serovar Bovismorbificans]CNU43121.1 Uncharacterised protein [Salmonella enterica subsp. enterica serovar Bovismorbificans]
MAALNQITTRHIAACKGVINHRVGKIGLRFTPVHHHHRNMAILFQHGKQRFWILRTHHQQAIHALLRHHGQVGALFFQVIPGVA